MVNPSSSLKLVSIEGSKERKQAGEYIIDVAEYCDDLDSKRETVASYQLKHSTKQLDSPFTLSGLKGTIEGFAGRYRARNDDSDGPVISHFTVITNRPIAKHLKENLEKLISGRATDKTFAKTIEKYTKLEGVRLTEFCSLLELNDGEGDYIEQRFDLHVELSELMAGVVDNSQVDTLISLVAESALPDNAGLIVREDVLKRLGQHLIENCFLRRPDLSPQVMRFGANSMTICCAALAYR
jgi:hypothetical protein